MLYAIEAEQPSDGRAREALLDRAMGLNRKRKSSEAIRRGRLPADGLSFVARSLSGAVVGTVRLWHVDAGGQAALLLGPLAVAPEAKGAGIGSALMVHAIEAAESFGHRAILLVGDAPYYKRFGFEAAPTGLAMPGPFSRERFLALTFTLGALDGAAGVLRPSGVKIHRAPAARALAAQAA
ncbi:GNAT family N-acetyltransferase [Notoacmeibacter sp. MSK16QG-6]|uniref:GNAT family N-acetyltransferase n=1 Tax=Notoacmeibacter sp. MSK16QG-6 TaxID=2957982 RepID=UPI00209F7070|nr:N-acetyltransferase [Notoacmeibacter sp. MSK16QG-6]MCP1200391.1 N-acetyltransferase [Notoacmeibacter sp. MSK16QG-6]